MTWRFGFDRPEGSIEFTQNDHPALAGGELSNRGRDRPAQVPYLLMHLSQLVEDRLESEVGGPAAGRGRLPHLEILNAHVQETRDRHRLPGGA